MFPSIKETIFNLKKYMESFIDYTFASCVQDGRIDYSEFVAMMQRGNTELVKNGLQGKNFSIGFREALSVY